MPTCRWTLPLIAVIASGQEALPFPADVSEPWKPAWELTLRSDQLANPGETASSFQRTDLQLRLRGSWDWDSLRLVAGTRSAMGSDGNRFNGARWDQQPSNGTQVDVAHGDLSWVSGRTFAAVNLGFQENGLLASQAIWDRNLRLLGAGGMVGFRGTDGVLQEAGLRAVAGRVRTILGGRVDLAAAQVVLKLDTGPWSWAAHAGRWDLSWDPGVERLRQLPGHNPLERQNQSLNAAGASTTWNTILPFEARWFAARNRATGESSEEIQAAIGSRERTYWPQVSFTYQRLSPTGTLYAVNGDEWWFYRSARGHRIDVSLPLPGRWLASLAYLRQRADGEDYLVSRTLVGLAKRF